MEGDTTVVVPTGAVQEAANIAEGAAHQSEVAAVEATGEAHVAQIAAAEVIDQLQEDEEWLEKRMTHLETMISQVPANLRGLMSEMLSPLVAAAVEKDRMILELSNRVTSLTVVPTPIAEPVAVVVVDPVAAEIPESETPRAKKRVKI